MISKDQIFQLLAQQQIQKQMQSMSSNVPRIVGGIEYKSISNNPEKTQEQDIYGDPIDLLNLLTYAHEPVSITEPVASGYQKKYNFATPEPVATIPVVTSVETPIVTTASEQPVVTVPITVKQEPEKQHTEILTGKDGFKKLEKLYEKALEKRGLDKSYAKWLASQDALESGWGKSQGAKRHNYGNLTTGVWNGESFVGDDHDAKGRKIKQTFRAYSSANEYVEDKLDFLQKLKRYEDVFVGDPTQVIDRMFAAGYAVDPEYVNKVKRLYNTWA